MTDINATQVASNAAQAVQVADTKSIIDIAFKFFSDVETHHPVAIEVLKSLLATRFFSGVR